MCNVTTRYKQAGPVFVSSEEKNTVLSLKLSLVKDVSAENVHTVLSCLHVKIEILKKKSVHFYVT